MIQVGSLVRIRANAREIQRGIDERRGGAILTWSHDMDRTLGMIGVVINIIRNEIWGKVYRIRIPYRSGLRSGARTVWELREWEAGRYEFADVSYSPWSYYPECVMEVR